MAFRRSARAAAAPAPVGSHRGPRGTIAWLAWGAACLAGTVSPLAAQEPEHRASATLEASVALTRLQGSAAWMGGATGLLGLTSRFSVGGSGMLALSPQRVPGSGPGSELDLRMAFGGVVGHLVLVQDGPREGWVRLLAGAGNAKLDLAVARTQIAADNFAVFQPEVGGSVVVAGPLRAGGAVGYRGAFGVEDLPGVGALGLRGFSGRVFVAIHHR